MPRTQLLDLTGKQFGRWTVLERSQDDTRGTPKWVCRCECGTERIVYGNTLKSGRSKSCGCYHKEVSSRQFGEYTRKPIALQTRFGSLVVIRETEKRSSVGSVVYTCQCDCGKVLDIPRDSLVSGKRTTCGCKRKKPENYSRRGLSNHPVYQRWRRAIKIEADKDWTLEMTIAIFDYFKACAICGWEDKLQIDHVLPSSKGFGLKPGNAILLCAHCNSKKQDKDLSELPEIVRQRIEKAAKDFEKHIG